MGRDDAPASKANDKWLDRAKDTASREILPTVHPSCDCKEQQVPKYHFFYFNVIKITRYKLTELRNTEENERGGGGGRE